MQPTVSVMQISVISRKDDKLRREKIQKQFGDRAVNWSFFDAYEGHNIPDWFSSIYDDKKTVNYRSYGLVPAEKGCFSSHIALWIKCFNENEPYIILEDDSILLEGFFDVVKSLPESGYEYVKLERRCDGYCIDSSYMVNKKNRTGTTGYYLTPSAAFKLISGLNSIYMPADHYVGFCWHHFVKPIGLINEVVTHKTNLTTTIQNDRKIKEKKVRWNKWLRLRRRLRRWADIYNYNKYIKKLPEYKESLR